MSWFAFLLQVVLGIAKAGLVAVFLVAIAATVQLVLDLRSDRYHYVPRHSGRS